MQHDQENPVVSRQVIEMITVAHEYCLYFEQVEKYSSNDVLSFFQKIAPLLYLKGTLLPVELESEPQYAERYVTEEQWEVIFKNLRDKFAENDLYFALNENADSAQYSLADNMADVYQDMKDFVMLYAKAPMPGKTAAVAELQKLFITHWGAVLLRALPAVHNILYSGSEEEIDFEDEWE